MLRGSWATSRVSRRGAGTEGLLWRREGERVRSCVRQPRFSKRVCCEGSLQAPCPHLGKGGLLTALRGFSSCCFLLQV